MKFKTWTHLSYLLLKISSRPGRESERKEGEGIVKVLRRQGSLSGSCKNKYQDKKNTTVHYTTQRNEKESSSTELGDSVTPI